MKEKEFWFRRKLYGWGWFPANWKGWMATLLYVILVTGVSYLPPLFGVGNLVAWFLAYLFVITVLFVVVAWKTGESPCWQWGEKK